MTHPSINVEYRQKQKDGTYKVCVREQSWNAETQLVYDKKPWFAIFPVEFKSEKSNSQSIIEKSENQAWIDTV